MNCKPGDLAVCTYYTKRTLLVEVMERYTGREFAGKLTTQGEWAQPCWLVRVLSEKGLRTNIDDKRWVVVPMPDAWLRPIRPDAVTHEEVRELFAPKQPEVV